MTDPNQRPGAAIERLTLVHAGVFLVATTWLFGGNAGWVRPYLAAWGTLGIALAPFAAASEARRSGNSRAVAALWPFLLFNALVLASCLTPGFHRVQSGSEELLAVTPVPSWRPSAAVPAAALAGLWLFDGIYLSSFNLLLAVRTRRSLRGLAILAVANAVVLSVFGTAQKLAGAPGPYFGLVRTPQKFFFSSFIYHNHWGAFAVLMAAACLGLVVRQARRMRGQTFFRSSAMAGLVAVLFIAATPPLSGSRSCSALMVVLLSGAFVAWIVRAARKRSYLNESPVPPILGAFLAVAVALAGVWYISRDMIETRVAATEQQISDLRAEGSLGQRSRLYGDTWLMAEDRLWFGWGMASYPYVFPIYNSQDYPNPVDNLQNNYHDAHNDWLQSVAEHGLVGTAVAGLMALVPLALLRGRPRPSPFAGYLLAGCALIAAYAWIEFPFGNVAVVLGWWLCFFTAIGYARLDSGARPAKSAASNP
jgi:O-antigen ligase